eukprot:scaffold10570_cov290-Chaetoceros_neogracile.AAC.32
MSEPYGHNIATAREAGMKALNNLRGLEGIHDIHGFRARVKELNQFNVVGLNLNKTFAMDAERRFTVQKGKLQRREMERKLAKAMLEKNNETTVVRFEREAEREQHHAIHNNLKSMIKRRKIVASTICSSSIGGNVTVPLPSHQMTICNSVSGIPPTAVKVNELHDDGNIITYTPTNVEDDSSGSSTEAEASLTPQPTRSPTAATDIIAPKNNRNSSADEIDDANKNSVTNDATDATTPDDGGTVEEDGNIDVDESVGEDITSLNVTDTVFSKNQTAEKSGNDTDPTSNDASDNNDNDTAEEDGKDIVDVRATGTVSGDDESAEESGNDIDPASDDNVKDDEHVTDQKTTEEVVCSIELDSSDADPKESAEEDVGR